MRHSGEVSIGVLGIEEPLDPALARLLRRATLDHACGERRRRFPPVLHVGCPGGTETAFPAAAVQADDQALQVEVLAAMLRRVGAVAHGEPSLVWLTRDGPSELGDLDVAWLSATRAVAAETGSSLRLVVLDRHGWRDPATGVSRRWRRLRPRS